MIDLQTLEHGLYDWVYAGCPGWRCIQVMDNANRPLGNCISIRLVKSNAAGFGWNTAVDINGYSRRRKNHELTFELVAYGYQAIPILDQLLENSSEDSIETLRTATGLAVLSYGDIIDMSAVVGTEWEVRAGVQVMFSIGIEYAQRDVGIIESGEIQSSLVISDEKTKEITIEIPEV